MTKRNVIAVCIFLSVITPSLSFAWGAKGHELVAEIAFHFLDDSTKSVVKKYLGSLSIEEAANWMDYNKSNNFYNYMRTWHYINIPKGETYVPSPEKNVVTVLNAAIEQLKHKETLKRSEIKQDLLLIFHLVGDLHQPLHAGYPTDKGGNDVEIKAPNFSSNLHAAWDGEIIDEKKISLESCLKHYDSYSSIEKQNLEKINILTWMKESRSYLDTAYQITKGKVTQSYVDNNAVIIEKQILNGGLRLAAILRTVFKSANSI